MARPTFLDPLVNHSSDRFELVNVGRGSVLATRTEPAFDSSSRRRGLLGRHAMHDGAALVIAPCNSVHTFFMRFSIDLLFVSRDGTVVKTCRGVRPWRVAGAWRAFAVVEAAPGCVDGSRTEVGDVLALRQPQP